MNTKNSKTTSNYTSYLSGNNYLSSQNSLSKSLQKSTDNPYMHYQSSNDRNNKELKMNYLNSQINKLQEYKKTAMSSIAKGRKDILHQTSPRKSEYLKTGTSQNFHSRNNVRTKLIPKERFINSSLTSADFKKNLGQSNNARDISREHTENDAYLDNDLELLDFKGFESTLKRDTYNDQRTTKQSNPMYNSEILDLLTKKHMSSECNSPRNRYVKSSNHRSASYNKDENIDINVGSYIKYSKNAASVPRNNTKTNIASYTDIHAKMNTSNMTLESKNSEKSFNNNILFTDGGITNINIHGILTCEDIPNEIYFNDKRYRMLQDNMANTLQENYKNNETIREMKRTIEILKCYIKIQEVKFKINFRMLL
jgi:hypothetical protein